MDKKLEADIENLIQAAKKTNEISEEDIANNAIMQWEAEDGYNEQEMQ